jgi:UDP-N-acetylglucosamine acyltransferase
MSYVHVAHDCIIGNHVILVNGSQIGGHVEIEDHAIISGLCAVHQFVKIGAHVMLAGGCVARKDIPPFVRAGKSPLKFAGVNVIGLRRRGYTVDQINTIREAYRILYQSGLNNTAALKTIESDLAESDEKNVIVTFLKNAKRGIIPAYTSKAAVSADDDDL